MKFPVISIIEDEMAVFGKPEFYFVCPRDYMLELNKMDEKIIDSDGILLQRSAVVFSKYINFFGGFSLKFARFSICFVDKKVEVIRQLELVDIKEILFRR
jgi:hypothetical protein